MDVALEGRSEAEALGVCHDAPSRSRERRVTWREVVDVLWVI